MVAPGLLHEPVLARRGQLPARTGGQPLGPERGLGRVVTEPERAGSPEPGDGIGVGRGHVDVVAGVQVGGVVDTVADPRLPSRTRWSAGGEDGPYAKACAAVVEP